MKAAAARARSSHVPVWKKRSNLKKYVRATAHPGHVRWVGRGPLKQLEHTVSGRLSAADHDDPPPSQPRELFGGQLQQGV